MSELFSHDRPKWVPHAVVALIVFGAAPFFVAIWRIYPTSNEDQAAAVKDILAQWSNWGQMFGFLAAIFSGVALLMMVRQLELQRAELKLQRKELGLTRDELKRSATAQENSERALAAQVQQAVNASHLNAVSALAEHYAGIYSANRDIHDKQYSAAEQTEKMHTGKMPPGDLTRNHTIKGKMFFYRKELEQLFLSLKQPSKFDPPDEEVTPVVDPPSPPIAPARTNFSTRG